jgi:hypothetical protein
MFVGWPRTSFEQDIENFSQQLLCDKNLVLKTHNVYPDLTFVAYDGDILQGYIGAYMFESRVVINSFDYLETLDDTAKERLVSLLMQNIGDRVDSVEVLAHLSQAKVFEKFGFVSHSNFCQALYSGNSVAFNFSNATAKRISGEDYKSTIKAVDNKAYGHSRFEYISQIMKKSSLILSTPNGYQHSTMLNKGLLKLSPWVMVDSAYTDAEQLLRGVIYHRGLKKILAYIPSTIKEITDLYRSYNFKLSDEMILMYKGLEPKINLEMIYAY